MSDIFMYTTPPFPFLSLRRFLGVRAAASNVCWCSNSHTYTKEMFLADFPQFSKIVPTEASSTFDRDPSMVGGPNIIVSIDGYNATVSGEIAWYPEDTEVGRPAGNRAGFEIIAPTDLTDLEIENCIFSIDGSAPALLKDDPNVSGNPRIFWWYPLVTANTTSHTLILDWDGLGPRNPETFTIHYENFTLQPPTEDALPIDSNSFTFRTTTRVDEPGEIESIVPDSILDMFIALAELAIDDCHWGSKWRLAMGLYVAHYAVLYLRTYSPASENNDAGSASGSGALLGLVKSAQLGDASVQYDVSSITAATEDWGAWNSTVYGQWLVTEARFAGLGGSYII